MKYLLFGHNGPLYPKPYRTLIEPLKGALVWGTWSLWESQLKSQSATLRFYWWRSKVVSTLGFFGVLALNPKPRNPETLNLYRSL